ncbi:GRAM domain-containing protein [Cunninghamella echinulata]|nr:GRAM domain-containing protein [Cunninghamella echinulata]
MTFEQEEVDQEKQTRRTQRWKERLSKTSAIHQLLNPTTTTTTTAMNGTHAATSTSTPTSSPTSASSSVTITEDNDNKDKENILSQPTISTNSKPSIYLQQQQQHNGNSSAITTSTTILPDSIKNKEFHNNFKNIPIEDTLLQEFKCALQKDVLLQGKLYITKNNICFKSNIFGYVTCVEISVKDIKSIERVRVIKLMPRVIQIIMKNDEKVRTI